MTMRPEKLCVPAVAAETHDQTAAQHGRYTDGRTLVMIMLDGSCISI